MFGAKVSIAVTAKDSRVVGARTFKGNPYDGHTLEGAFDQIKVITEHTPKQVYVDRGYRAAYLGQQTDDHHGTEAAQQSNQTADEAAKQCGTDRRQSLKMQRNWLKGHLATSWCRCWLASGFNLKKILRALALFAPETHRWIMGLLADFDTKAENSNQHHKQINKLLVA